MTSKRPGIFSNRPIGFDLHIAKSAQRLIDALEVDDEPDDQDLNDIAEWFDAILGNPHHPWRPMLGLSVKRGRPNSGTDERIVWFVNLAEAYGHGRVEAYELAAEAFGFKSARTIEKKLAQSDAAQARLFGPTARVWEALLRQSRGPLPARLPSKRRARRRVKKKSGR
jgi:hypothetical protein